MEASKKADETLALQEAEEAARNKKLADKKIKEEEGRRKKVHSVVCGGGVRLLTCIFTFTKTSFCKSCMGDRTFWQR